MRTLIVVAMAVGLGLNGWNAYALEDSRHALAEELLNEMNMKETVEKSFEMIKKMMPAQMAKMRESMEKAGTPSSAGKPTGEAIDKMMSKMMDVVTQELSWDTMKDEYIAIYADTFTEEELQGLIAFYKSPVGKAFTKKQPTVMEQSMKLSQKRMMQIMPKIMTMAKEMKEEASQNKEIAPQKEEPKKEGE